MIYICLRLMLKLWQKHPQSRINQLYVWEGKKHATLWTCHVCIYQNNVPLAHNKCKADNDLVPLQHYNKQKIAVLQLLLQFLPATVASTATCIYLHLSNYSVLLQDTRGCCSQVTLHFLSLHHITAVLAFSCNITAVYNSRKNGKC